MSQSSFSLSVERQFKDSVTTCFITSYSVFCRLQIMRALRRGFASVSREVADIGIVGRVNYGFDLWRSEI